MDTVVLIEKGREEESQLELEYYFVSAKSIIYTVHKDTRSSIRFIINRCACGRYIIYRLT